MYHSIIIGEKNTWDDWHLVPSSRPVIQPPSQKKKEIEIPGASGFLDLSESLTGYPIYQHREGSFEFYVMNGYQDWDVLFSEILDYLHGVKHRVTLEDDPHYFYYGTLALNQWKSEKDYSKVVIDYSVDPYKYYEFGSLEEWLWDPFDFETGVITSEIFDIDVNSDTEWYELDIDKEYIGRMPLSPDFIVTCENDKGLDVRYVSPDSDVTANFKNGNNRNEDIIFKYQDSKLYVKGVGNLKVSFRSGRL